MGSMSAPKAPDPYETAQAQGAMNKETAETQARLNRIDEYGPNGSSVYRETGMEANPYMRITTLSDDQQALYDSQNASELKLADLGGDLIDRVAPGMATPFDLSGAPDVNRFDMSGAPTVNQYQRQDPSQLSNFSMEGAPRVNEMKMSMSGGGGSGKYNMDGAPAMPVADAAERQRIEAALMERMQPHLEQYEESQRTRLANTGFDMNSEGYNKGMDVVNRRNNDARLGAIAQGGDEMARLFGMQAQARGLAGQEEANRVGFQNQGRAQNLQATAQQNAAKQAMFNSQLAHRGMVGNERMAELGINNQNALTNYAQNQEQQNLDLGYQNDARNQYMTEQGQQTQYDTSARNAYINEEAMKRSQPLNEIAALLGTGQVQGPQLNPIPQVGLASPDLMGLTQQQYQAQLKNHQAGLGGMAGIAGSLLGAPSGGFATSLLGNFLK